MIRVALIGSTGYTALEVARLLLAHPQAELTVATSRSDEGKPLAEIHPSLAGRCEIALQEFAPARIAEQADVAMCCLPHGASAETVRELAAVGIRVIDFSADFRLSSVPLYEHWYGVKHPWPERIGSVVYGMPEYYADEIATADIVANPGCYPTSAIMPLAPLVRDRLIENDDIIVDSKSGVSGAGRSPKLGTLYCEVNESIAAYAIASHRHGPEMQDLIHRISGESVQILFTPHLTPMDRGILSTIYVRPKLLEGDTVETVQTRLMGALRHAYQGQPFVHVVDHIPATKHVVMTNHVQMTVRVAGEKNSPGRAVIVCAIDNLSKGASSAAIQNMNVMFGLDATTGL
ncbi:N-acetyl-gamma-glutamyl-phosphate reductase [Allorhodopirellula heiligendammensis]|uniref:N-acetyl-gamma-glutamyl-phosphate reductase n=1 Tax=Allorhodopirellula heiligendammensis TaxID=2714739 RepID=A0A5C6C568_9BACT|nr:N-acetyl-gamma-glutamyl-phosphate reductase [Allorhodopirellula heiligendammensis]TWU18691.1 N-acetyl-gamma-glutamyl-phosphate reductase [Allorhodopirellula heiligendammensis]